MPIMDGKKVVVTGAARGIGQAIALRFAEEGADLALCDLKAEWLEETAQAAAGMGAQVKCYSVDVSDFEQVKDTVKQIGSDLGGLDVLVNNAGITKDGFMMRMSEEDWDAVLNVNLKGTFAFTKAATRIMIKQRSGAIVNIASIIGLIGNAGQCNYSASKGGVIAMTKSVAKEMASRNIRANAVAPGFIETAMTDALPEENRAAMMNLIPLARLGQPRDVANTVLFLASDEASYITGQVLNVCGGMVT
jgi:3-oxoacyl-[acyl-carrier protein] reductase